MTTLLCLKRTGRIWIVYLCVWEIPGAYDIFLTVGLGRPVGSHKQAPASPIVFPTYEGRIWLHGGV